MGPAAPGNGLYSFASSTPHTLLELVERKGAPQAVVGHLFLPVNKTNAPIPAVVLMHGSGGVYRELLEFWPQLLNDQGIAAFVVDSFSPRGVQSTVEDQSRVPMPADVADAFAALGLLATHPRIDKARIGIMGFSRGGTTAWRTAVNRLIEGAAPQGLRFAAHVPQYSGGCAGLSSMVVKAGVFDAAPMLWIHGADDDYTSAADCKAYSDRIAAAGTPSDFLLLPGARHKYDATDPRRYTLRAAQKTRPGCPLSLDATQRFAPVDLRSGQAMSWQAAQALNREQCFELGATIEGSASARKTAAAAVVEFFKRVLKP